MVHDEQYPDVAVSLHNLAGLHQAQEQYAQAEPLYRRSQELWENAPGPSRSMALTISCSSSGGPIPAGSVQRRRDRLREEGGATGCCQLGSGLGTVTTSFI